MERNQTIRDMKAEILYKYGKLLNVADQRKL